MAITTGKMRPISANERVSATKEEGSQSGAPPVKERCSEQCPDSPLGTRRGEGLLWGLEDSSPQGEGSRALTDGMFRTLKDDPGTAEH